MALDVGTFGDGLCDGIFGGNLASNDILACFLRGICPCISLILHTIAFSSGPAALNEEKSRDQAEIVNVCMIFMIK